MSESTTDAPRGSSATIVASLSKSDNEEENPPKLRHEGDGETSLRSGITPGASSPAKSSIENDNGTRGDTGRNGEEENSSFWRRSSRHRKATTFLRDENFYDDIVTPKKKKRKSALELSPTNSNSNTTPTNVRNVTSKKKKRVGRPSLKQQEMNDDGGKEYESEVPANGIWTTVGSPYIGGQCRRTIPPFLTVISTERLQFATGTITSWCPSKQRTPSLYQVVFSTYTEDLTEEEVQIGMAAHAKRGATSLTQDHYSNEMLKIDKYFLRVEEMGKDMMLMVVREEILPVLCGVAMGELLKEKEVFAKQQQLLLLANGNADIDSTSSASISTPEYYKHNPSSYLRAPAGSLTEESTDSPSHTAEHFFSPGQIGQRIRAGASLALEYHKHRSMEVRRSSRHSGLAPQSLPTTYEPGGTVARHLLAVLKPQLEELYAADEGTRAGQRPSWNLLIAHIGKNASVTLSASEIQMALMHPDSFDFICQSGEGRGELMGVDTITFGRVRLGKIHSLTREEQVSKLEDHVEETSDHQKIKEEQSAQLSFEQRKEFETWRYKGIHEGYSTVYTNWMSVVNQLITHEIKTVPEDTTTTTMADEEMAKTLADAEHSAATSGNTRRSTRREASTNEPVFYGTASGFTQAQLNDSLHRMIVSAQPSGLRLFDFKKVLLEEDGSSIGGVNMKRLKVGLGKLLYREGKVRRVIVYGEEEEKKSHQENKVTTTKKELNAKEESLNHYLKELKTTEKQLRSMIMNKLQVNLENIVGSADDDAVMDENKQDENDSHDHTQVFQEEGHTLIHQALLRQGGGGSLDTYIVNGYCPAIPTADDKEKKGEDTTSNKSSTECPIVEKRARFRCSQENKDTPNLILTEGQVRAGMEAIKMHQRHKQEHDNAIQNKEVYLGEQVSVISIHDENDVTEATIVAFGKHCVRDEARILLLTDTPSSPSSSYWATFHLPTLELTHPTKCKLVFHSPTLSSNPIPTQILSFLKSHPRIQPFLTPVDPIALNIPEYPEVIKQPMDVSTMEKKLYQNKYKSDQEFETDVYLMFDNAMRFNGADSWIYSDANLLKKEARKRINKNRSKSHVEQESGGNRESVYYEAEDSEYSFEEDQDDSHEFTSKKPKGGRKKGAMPQQQTYQHQRDTALGLSVIESAYRVPSTLHNGVWNNNFEIPINSDTKSFSLPECWTCRRASPPVKKKKPKNDLELEEEIEGSSALTEEEKMIMLYHQHSVTNSTSRRSVRSRGERNTNISSRTNSNKPSSLKNIEYYMLDPASTFDQQQPCTGKTRAEVEGVLATLHESYYARLFHQFTSHDEHDENDDPESIIHSPDAYSFSSFPPYLGRVSNSKWEIQQLYILPALRWVLRGLIHSGHLSELEEGAFKFSPPLTGVVVVNNIYYWNNHIQPMEVVEVKKSYNKKELSESEEEVEEKELSYYEKLRLERVARNKERLKALGLG